MRTRRSKSGIIEQAGGLKRILIGGAILIGVAFLGSTMFKSCGGGGGAYMPADRPEDLQISYQRRGGIEPQPEKILLSAQGCKYEFGRGSLAHSHDFSLPKEDLDSLYRTLKSANAPGIYTYGEAKKDSASPELGTILDLSWGGTQHIIDNTGDRFARRGDEKNLLRILNDITQFTQAGITKQRIRYGLRIENLEALTGIRSLGIRFHTYRRTWLESDFPERVEKEVSQFLLPGKYEFQVQLELKDGYKASFKDTLDVIEGAESYSFDLGRLKKPVE